jgi:hypothetical protein
MIFSHFIRALAPCPRPNTSLSTEETKFADPINQEIFHAQHAMVGAVFNHGTTGRKAGGEFPDANEVRYAIAVISGVQNSRVGSKASHSPNFDVGPL